MTRVGEEAPPFLRKLAYRWFRKGRHFMEVMMRLGQEAPPFLRKLCFAYGRKRHFHGSGNTTQYITTTFKSPRWCRTRRPPRSSSECNYRGGCAASTCLSSRRPCCSAVTRTLPAMVVVVGRPGLPTTRTNEQTNERTNERTRVLFM